MRRQIPCAAVRVVQMVTDRGVPGRAQRGRGVVQAAGPEHVPGPAVGPVPPLPAGVVLPLAVVDHAVEPFGPGEGVGGLVQDPLPRLLVTDPVRALGVPVRSHERGQAAARDGQHGDDQLVLVGPQLPAERGRVVGRVPDQDAAADIQGDAGQRVPEVAGSVAAQRAGDRLDAVAPHQAAVVAVWAHGQRGLGPVAVRARHRAPHPDLAGQPPQPRPGGLPVRRPDLLDGQHVRGQGLDRLRDQPVALARGGRFILEQVEHVVAGEQHGIRGGPGQAHGRLLCILAVRARATGRGSAGHGPCFAGEVGARQCQHGQCAARGLIQAMFRTAALAGPGSACGAADGSAAPLGAAARGPARARSPRPRSGCSRPAWRGYSRRARWRS